MGDTVTGPKEVLEGSVQHEQLLSAYPNVTSYASDVVIVEVERPPAAVKPVNRDVPYAAQNADRLTCTMGNWEGEPTHYSYEWKHDDTIVGDNDPEYILVAADSGKSFTCTVTASNAAGSTAAPPSNAVVATVLAKTIAPVKGKLQCLVQ